MRLAIDVGGAHTAAVLTDRTGRVRAEAVSDSAPGIGTCVRRVLASLGPLPAAPDTVAVVTDLDRRRYAAPPLAVVRIAPDAHPALAPLADWPAAARDRIRALTATVAGGSALTGRAPGPLDEEALAAFAARAHRAGVSVFALCAAGAPARPGPELAAATVVARTAPGAAVSLSYEIGSPGLRERENATALNAALGAWADTLVADCRAALRSAGVTAPLFFARDDGGLVVAEYFRRHPVLGTSPATACAARGAAARTGHERAVVVDAGAREVRCLVLREGEPERTAGPVPGPFGVRVALGSPVVVRGALSGETVGTLTSRLLARVPGAPVVHTGGGGDVIGAPPADPAERTARLTDAARHAATARCQVELDEVISSAGRAELDQLLDAARGHALSRCVAAGADPATVRVDSLLQSPVAYLPAGVHRVTVRAAGQPLGGADR
ncbi:hydantoinase/oxoprolinase family protein [Streptomyces mangrovisoli]|uniref:Hydantoinase A/oxoprolinase domain-containing protein n=1 Tax=Streptomyces mangrovisoli TaxID=1428628 RepID=A0A1J4NQK0_9ACTN|nr:hydantoinase/oxoprolinase family protein [Streptomyces mangrovisoli]OIJ63876.1 hypothetical protein WN71_031175 [Streptomyces mangrovisoli]